jgi:hypothetical protein
MERAQVGATPRDVRDLAEFYGVSEAERDALVQIARDARRPGMWSSAFQSLPRALTYAGFEAEANLIRVHADDLVPGLLQTKEYAREIIKSLYPDRGPEDVDLSLELRARRQARLTQERRSSLTYVAILDEAVLRRPVGGEAVMRRQLEHLLEVAAAEPVTIQVVPFAFGAHPGLGGLFSLLSFPDPADSDILFIETLGGGSYIDDPDQLALYSATFKRLEAMALPERETLALIRDVAASFSSS